ncbi:MAG: hypothetical protein DI535_13130 [Citrobacter freundii]|nr:MAG: hypothetical protein DI535_13130 [Citrobacter freundii]
MKRLLGISCITVTILGLFFFRNYQGSLIPFPFVWVTLLIGIGGFGFFLIYLSYKQKFDRIDSTVNEQIKSFKANATRILVDFDKCEFRSGSYRIEKDHPSVPLVAILVPTALAFDDNTVIENISSSYLIYTHDENGTERRYISQAFPFEEPVLKMHVLKKEVSLYVSNLGDGRYYFELENK